MVSYYGRANNKVFNVWPANPLNSGLYIIIENNVLNKHSYPPTECATDDNVPVEVTLMMICSPYSAATSAKKDIINFRRITIHCFRIMTRIKLKINVNKQRNCN